MKEYFVIKDLIWKNYYHESIGIFMGIYTFEKNINTAYKFNTEIDAEFKIISLLNRQMRISNYIILKITK